MSKTLAWSLIRSFCVLTVFVVSSPFMSGGITLTGEGLLLMGAALILIIFLFRLGSVRLYHKFGKKPVLILDLTLFVLISLYLSCLRIFICANGIPFFMEFFSFFGLGVLPQALPSPSNPPSDSSQSRWESFDEEVLLEGWPVARDLGLEASIRSRISSLENSDCVFLLGKAKGEFWNDVKGQLEGCTTQEEYNQKVRFENRDLQVREQRHSCYTYWRHLLSEHPSLAQRAAYNPYDTIVDFFEEERGSLDREYHLNLLPPEENSNLLSREARFKKPSEVDAEEILFLQEVERDLRDRGVNSVYIGRLLGHSDS